MLPSDMVMGGSAMDNTAGLKRAQIHGKRYDLPNEDIEIEKLIQKGLSLSEKIDDLNERLNQVKAHIIDIGKKRRKGETTVTLKGISGSTTITFRESYECSETVDEIAGNIGSLFDRFFEKKTGFKTTKELKGFLEGDNDHGLKDYDKLKALILTHVQKKETKPNVKFTPAS